MDPVRLDAVPLLAGLPPADRAAVAALARTTDVDAGEMLARDGELAYELIVIEDGEAELHYGEELFARLSAGDVFGEIGALERSIGMTSLVAVTPMRLITLSARDIRLLRRTAPATVARLQGLLLRRRVNVRC